MKQLSLVRHARAESALDGQSDFERALTRRGVEDAAEMARRLKLRKLHVDYILSSPASRAFATAEIFARSLKLALNRLEKDDRLYTAGPNEFLTVLRELGDVHEHALIVAHNPGITEFADKLSHERRIDAMPTGSVVTMHFDIAMWMDINWHQGADVELDYPGRQN
jgi:phosphohistidine phosphatase